MSVQNICAEISRQFGMRHCIYYECLMNGISSAKEQRDGGIKLLCPICQRKLQYNIEFDATERFDKLLEACMKLGLEEEANFYRKIKEDLVKSAIKARPIT